MEKLCKYRKKFPLKIILIYLFIILTSHIWSCTDNTKQNNILSLFNNNNLVEKDLKNKIVWNFKPKFDLTPNITVSDGFAIVSAKLDDNKERIYCVELETGAWIWTLDTEKSITSSFVISDRKIFFCTNINNNSGENNSLLYCIDLYKGIVNWSKKLCSINNSSPIVVDGVLFLSCSLATKQISNIYAIYAYNGKTLWTTTIKAKPISIISYYENKIYFLAGHSSLFCLESKTGKELWLNNINNKIVGNLVIDKDKIYIGISSGEIKCFDALSGKELWEININNMDSSEKIISTAFIEKNNLFIASEYKLYYLNMEIKDIKSIFKSNSPIPIGTSPIKFDKSIFITSKNILYNINSLSNNLEREIIFEANIISTPIIYNSHIYIIISGSDGGLLKISLVSNEYKTVYTWTSPQRNTTQNQDARKQISYYYNRNEMIESDKVKYKKGNLIWKFTDNTIISSDLVIHKGRVFFITKNNSLYCISLDKGKRIWELPIDEVLLVKPLIKDDYIYVLTKEGKINKINIEEGVRVGEKKLCDVQNTSTIPIKFHNNNLIISNYDKKIIFIDIKKLNINKILEFKSPISIEPYYKEGSIIFIDSGGNIVSYNIEKNIIEWENQVEKIISKPITTYGFSLYFNTFNGKFISLDSYNGELKWEFDDNFTLNDNVTSMKGNIYIGTNRGVYCLQDGKYENKIKWYHSNKNIIGNIIVKNKRIWAITRLSDLFCLSAETGFKQWEVNLSSKVSLSLISPDFRIFVTTKNGIIYVINSLNGKLLWKIKLKDNIIKRAPLVIDNRLLIATNKNIKAFYSGDDNKIRKKVFNYPLLELKDKKENSLKNKEIEINSNIISTKERIKILRELEKLPQNKD